MNPEDKYINDLIHHTRESIRFFSNEMKSERERSVAAAFIRCLGVNFELNQIISYKDDPPDVVFQNANFEVVELYDSRRKRLDQLKERLKVLESARSINETLVDVKFPEPISYTKLFKHISDTLTIKEAKYGEKICSGLDALVYIGLPDIFLDIKSMIPKPCGFPNKVWRSVSFVSPPFSHVIYCEKDAPECLINFAGITRSEWRDPDGFFDLSTE